MKLGIACWLTASTFYVDGVSEGCHGSGGSPSWATMTPYYGSYVVSSFIITISNPAPLHVGLLSPPLSMLEGHMQDCGSSNDNHIASM